MNTQRDLQPLAREMEAVLRDRMIPFWLDRGVDSDFGGYRTLVDEQGRVQEQKLKQIVTQSRMLWGFSALAAAAAPEDRPRMELAARQGFRFLADHFWDRSNGGFVWQTNRKGAVVDRGKLVYGQSFAIYALSAYHLAWGDREALELAERTFDLLQIHAADTANGGYLENLEEDWSPAAAGFYAGDRKSLDIHMHLMEAFTTLYQASGKALHRRKLLEVMDVIQTRMVEQEEGYGRNQFDLRFHKLPAINIYRTWNAERESNEEIPEPADTTSYGHNVELSWLLHRAYEVLGELPPESDDLCRRLLDHSLRCGYDHQHGGLYRDGMGSGPVLVTDKEWWQNFEALVGYLDGYLRYGSEEYAEALVGTWSFIKQHFLIPELGESRQLLTREGAPIVSDIGNHWKAIYHTGRALAECVHAVQAVEEGRFGA